MKTVGGRIALHCDKHQFRDKMTVSIQLLFEQSGRNEAKKTRRKMALLQPHCTLLRLAVFRMAVGHL